MVFQNPYSSLNPALTIGFQLDEVAPTPGLSKQEARKASLDALRLMNIGDPEAVVRRYPHQVSGGIQQRICIAMAILCKPDLMILDEPTTALDVTTEAVILDSIKELREKLNISLMYISHDMGVINKVAEQVVVMYNGEIVERGPKQQIFDHPLHPYTRALINCMPRGGVVRRRSKLQQSTAMSGGGWQETGCRRRPLRQAHADVRGRYGIREFPNDTSRHVIARMRRICPTNYRETRSEKRAQQNRKAARVMLSIKGLHKVYGNKGKYMRWKARFIVHPGR
jgi:ABC-type dipeptide/oligopeptide/nickel transport system ATPase component